MSQPVMIEGDLFCDARHALNAAMAKTIREAIKGEFSGGTVTLKIEIGLENYGTNEEPVIVPCFDYTVKAGLKKQGTEKGRIRVDGLVLRNEEGNPYRYELVDEGQLRMEDM